MPQLETGASVNAPARDHSARETDSNANPLVASSPPATSPSGAARPPANVFRYVSDDWALDKLLALKRARGRTERGCPRTALALYVKLRKRADRAGHVRTSNDHLAAQIGVASRVTVYAAARLLVEAGLIDTPVRTYDHRGYVSGLDYRVRFDPAYVATVYQPDLPFKSSTSTGARGAPRPLTPATPKFVERVGWEVVGEQRDARARGEDVGPDRPPDVTTLQTRLQALGATATDAEIRGALASIARELARQQPLPLVGLVPRRTTTATAGRRTTTTAGLLATYARRDAVIQAYPEFAGVPTWVLWKLAEAEQAGDQEAAVYWRGRCARSAERAHDEAQTGTDG